MPTFKCLLVILLSLACCKDAAGLEPTNHLNVVLILADDLAYGDLGFMGNEIVHTPNLDALAARSAVFPNGYVPMSVCRPSLATLLTGLYPHQHGIHFNHPPPGLATMRQMTAAEYRQTRAATDYFIEQVATLPRILASHGYACLQTGKHWEGSFRTAGFTHGMTLGLPTNRESQITGTRAQSNGELVAHGNGDAGLVIGRETMQPIKEFLDAHAGKQPVFLWYAPFLPHTPFDAPKSFSTLYDQRNVAPQLLPYYAEIARFDATVGKLMAELRSHDLVEDTLIIFLSDNGFRPNAANPQRADSRSKLSEFENGLRTPVLLHWPSQLEFGIHEELVSSVDLLPTVLDATGLSHLASNRMQGRSLLSCARGDETWPDRPVFGAIYPNDASQLGRPADHVRGKWMRQGDFKLVVPGPAKNPVKLSLYDLSQDADEQRNLAHEERYARQRQAMEADLEAWWPAGHNDRVTPSPTRPAGPPNIK